MAVTPEVFDVRTAKANGEVAAIDTAVVVNPASDDAATGVALAPALRAPVLFGDRETVPSTTTDAIQALRANARLVVGGTDSIGDSVLGQLPAAKRLGGRDPEATNAAVAREWKDRSLAVNQVYVSDLSRPTDQAVVASAVSRIGALQPATRRAPAPGGPSIWWPASSPRRWSTGSSSPVAGPRAERIRS